LPGHRVSTRRGQLGGDWVKALLWGSGGVDKRGTQTGEGLTIRTKAPKVATVDAAHYQLQTARLGCRVSEHADEVGAAGGLVFGKDRYVARLSKDPIYGAFLGVGVEEASEQVDGDAITFPQ